MISPKIATLCATLSIAGCSGHLYHGPAKLADSGFPTNQADPNFKSETEEEGFVYAPRVQLIKQTTVHTKQCTTTWSVDLVTVVDTSKSQRIWYKPGLLETNKFAPTNGADGGLLSVSTESTPDKGETFKNLAAGVASLASVAAISAGGAKPNTVDLQQLRDANGNLISLPTPARPATPARRSCAESTQVAFFPFQGIDDLTTNPFPRQVVQRGVR